MNRKSMSAAFVAVIFAIALFVVFGIRFANKDESDFGKLAKNYEYSLVDGGLSDVHILKFERADRIVELEVVAETPRCLTIKYPQSGHGPISVTKLYQGHGSDHQFSNRAVVCKWNDLRVYMTPEEHNDLIIALKGGA